MIDNIKDHGRGRSLLLINPNTNGAVTGQVLRAALELAAPGIRIVATNPAVGPMSIEGPGDRDEAVPNVLALIEKGAEHDGFVLACFDDIAIEEARRLTSKPVFSLAEAGIRAAAARSDRFAIVTTFHGAIPGIERLVARYGFAGRCRVYATGAGVAEAAKRSASAEIGLAATIADIRQSGSAEMLVLGSGAYVGRSREIAALAGMPVVDGLEAAMALCLGQDFVSSDGSVR